MAIQALGCIQSDPSRQLLEQLNQDLQQTRLEEALQRQLKAQ
jgi:hypothetical protein